MSDIFNPPAIVAPAIKEGVAEVKAMNNTIGTSERKSVFDFIEMGKALWKLKANCTERGQWTRAMAEAGIAHQRASEAMRAAKPPDSGGFSKCKNLQELRESLSARGDEADDMPEPETDDPDAIPEALDTRKPGQEKWCGRCARLGTQTVGCMACEANRKSGKPTPKTTEPIFSFDHKRLWRSCNHFAEQVKALALSKHLSRDPAYIEAKEAIETARVKVQELQKKASDQ